MPRRPIRCSGRVPVCFAAVLLLITQGRLIAADGPPSITITIDDTAVSSLISLIDKHDDSEASIAAWMKLPANLELLKVGSDEADLLPQELHDNVKAVIDGVATERTQPRQSMGRVLLSPLSDYKQMLADLHAHAHEWLTRCANRDAMYCPDGITVNQTVYLHVGGDWDAINKDGSIFVNMAFFHDYFRPSWEGIDSIISHETFHAIQNKAFGNPEESDSGQSAFLTALSKIQREGMARLVENDADETGYQAYTYGFYFRAVNAEALRNFSKVIRELEPLHASCFPVFTPDKFKLLVQQGLNSGGDYYTIGYGIARAIEQFSGRTELIRTVRAGPLGFFGDYLRLTFTHPDLPKLPTGVLTFLLSRN